MIDFNHIASWVDEHAAIYSDSIEDNATTGCVVECHDIGAPANINT
jgi:hypothetical protein